MATNTETSKACMPYGKITGYLVNASGLLLGIFMIGPSALFFILLWGCLGFVVVFPLSIYDIFKKGLVVDGLVGVTLSVTAIVFAAIGVLFSIIISMVKYGS